MIDQPLKTKNIDLQQEGNPSLPAAGSGLVTLKAFRETAMQRMEKEYMVRLLEETQGDLTEMIRISGMGKSRIYELLEKHGLSLRKNRSLASTPNNPES
jgi:two-component system NtrC family response regulator